MTSMVASTAVPSSRVRARSGPPPRARQLRAVQRRTPPVAVLAVKASRVLGRFLAGPALAAFLRARDFLLHLLGFALVAYGAWLVYEPAGFVVGGLAVLYTQWLLAPSAEGTT